MNKLFKRQLAEATRETGTVDLGELELLVAAAYEEADRDRRRTDRSISLMAEEANRSQKRLLEAFDIVPEGLVLLDAEGRYVLFNKQYVEQFEIARDKIVVGRLFTDAVKAGLERGHYLDAVGREEVWLAERLTEVKAPHNLSEHHTIGDRWIRIDERRTSDGGSIGVRTDITDLKRREETLKKRTAQLVEAQRLGKIGDWSFKLGDGQIWWSPQVYDLLAYDPTKFVLSRENILAGYVGDDAKKVLSSHAEVLRTGKIVEVDVQVKRGDCTIGDFTVTSSAMTNDKGQVVGVAGTIQDISERKLAEAKLERLAYFDPLTGLANRTLFQRELNDVLTHCKNVGTSAALLSLDLDRFKEVNDSLGHASGDELLSKVSQLISRELGNNCFFSRLGGDEFAIVVQNYNDRATVENLASRVVELVSGSILLERGEVSIGTSIGIALVPSDGENIADLQRNADLALYRAKEQGRGRVVFFESGMSETVQHKIMLARELRRAISENVGLGVHYQPQVSLSNGRVIGFEALMRWSHPTLGNIPPSEFIPIAESSQLICDLGLWILRQAAGQAKAWLDAGEAPREIAVNVSAAQIWQTDFVRDVAQVLKETELPPNLLCLELTESLLVDRAEGRVLSVLTDLKKLGVMLALDDFGTGYSSLGYLTRLPFDKLKIDRIFVDGVADSSRSQGLLEGIIALGRGLGMVIVAEGAETVDEVEVLGRFRCDMIQGYVFSRPLPAKDALSVSKLFDASIFDRINSPTTAGAEISDDGEKSFAA